MIVYMCMCHSTVYVYMQWKGHHVGQSNGVLLKEVTDCILYNKLHGNCPSCNI